MQAASPRAGDFFEMTSRPVPAGFADLYAQHYESVFRAALRVTGDAADAEDVLQTVFLRVLAQGEHEQAAMRPAAYFRRAAVNAAVDLLRRRTARGESAYVDGADAAVEPAPLLREQLRRAVATLQPEDATLFLLRHVEGLSNEELADLFQLEKNNVAVRLHRIRMRLRTEMER
jgi:RNA polymerase sigma-70 factor (ECF subfamily)